MEERTRSYLRGRFGDYYRRSSVSLPPAAERREWGYIPWQLGGTSMIRHQSILDLGDLEDFLARERPQHVYFSAGQYRDPSADSMTEKNRLGTDLVFDLDADHLPEVDPESDSYAEMLNACKEELRRLLDLLEEDFGFDDIKIVFSGGRGYHVHVRDSMILELGREGRREIAAYIRGNDLEFEDLLRTEPVAGIGLRNPTEKRSLDTTGGWSRRVHRQLVSYVENLRAMPESDAIDRLQKFQGIGAKKAKAIITTADANVEQIKEGNVDVHPAFLSLARNMFERTLQRETAAIDEPVTTDVNRLIRLPESLHGGTGLQVTPLSAEDLEDFEPLVDAVPEQFMGHEIRIRVQSEEIVELGGETMQLQEGPASVPEYIAVFLMANDRAEKEKE